MDRILLGLALALAVGLFAWPVAWQFAVGVGIVLWVACVAGGLLHREWSR